MEELAPKAAGHKSAMFVYGGKLAKKLNEIEYEFYSVLELKQEHVKSIFPKWYGRKTINHQEYIILENLLAGFDKTLILDIKLGKRTYGDDASPEKVASMTRKDCESTTKEFGLRVSGISVEGKEHNRNLKSNCTNKWNTLQSAILDVFLQNLEESTRKEVVHNIIEKLVRIIQILDEVDVKMYSSSVLIVAELSCEKKDAKVKLIDFAHSKWEDDKRGISDCIFGIENLIKILQPLSI